MNIKKAEAIIVQVRDVTSRWNEFAEQTKVITELRDAINSTLQLL
jgi:hypothetical protein